MLWGCISFYGVGMLVVSEGKQNAEKYTQTLESGLLLAAAEVFGEQQTWLFQEDNAPIHTVGITRECLSERSIRTLPWLARSPDLNIVENVWGLLARKVYANNRSFETISDLKQTIVTEWESISTDYLFKLYRSIPRRLLSVIDKKGDATKY